MSLIEIKKLNFAYSPNLPILNDISLVMNDGTINVILGLNGSGKTTFIKLLAGLMKPTSGNILIDGKPVLKLSDHERSKLIAYVPQLTATHIAFTVEEYLLLSLSNQKGIYWKPNEKDKAKIGDYAIRLGVENEKLNRRVDELSGGEKQIVMICGALLQDAKIIILDEPTAALDMKNQYAVLRFLKKVHHDENKTIIFSCHDPNHALRLGGYVATIHNHGVFLSGESREIIKPEKLRQIYGDDLISASESNYTIITLRDF